MMPTPPNTNPANPTSPARQPGMPDPTRKPKPEDSFPGRPPAQK